jgi:hypothetical protein
MRRPRTLVLLLLSLSLVLIGACQLFLGDQSTTNCSTDADCAHFGAGATCVASLCVGPGGADSSVEGSSQGDGALADGQTPLGDGGFIFEGGFDGCFRGTPTTPDDLLNACSPASCVPYDNCAAIGLCNGAGLPDAAAPDAAAAAAVDAGPNPATVYCVDPTATPARTNVVYVTGSTNLPTFLSAVAPLLATNAPPYTIVWQASNSCTGVDTQFNPDPTKRLVKDAVGKQTFYYDATGNAIPCWLGDPTTNPGPNGVGNYSPGGSPSPLGGTTANIYVDVGEADIFSSSCAVKLKYSPDPSVNTVGEYFGPIQAMTFLVPQASSQQAISAEAAYVVYGNGGVGDAGTIPWNDPTYLFNRADSTGTNQIISRAIGVTPALWWGTQKASASAMAAQLEAVPAGAEEKTIGTISADLADAQRGNLRELAFQATGQKCAFWADSTQFTKDKINIRDGHYPMWGPLHFFTQLQTGAPSAAAGAFVLRFSSAKLDQPLVQAIALSGNVPACAMQVKRDTEMGPLSKADPPYNCGCFFDFTVNGSTTCSTCTTSTDCKDPAHPTCNYGYCESGN